MTNPTPPVSVAEIAPGVHAPDTNSLPVGKEDT